MMLSVVALTLAQAPAPTSDYRSDIHFLKQYTKVVELKLGESRVAVVPAWQARVMTSAVSPSQSSYGWINNSFIESRKLVPHMNVFGGEDRIWLGPEGGQFSIFFKAGAKFDLAHWQTPPFMDTVPFEVVRKSRSSLTCRKAGVLSNYSGTKFHVEVTRTVRLLSPKAAGEKLGVPLSAGVKVVAYESDNTLRNAGKKKWTDKTGLLSVWILGQFRHSPTTTVAIPFQEGAEDKLGPIVKDDYFGKVPSDRLVVGTKAVYFRVDGKYRSKIGMGPRRALDVLGSWEPKSGVLTLLQYSKPDTTKYVNSAWAIQAHPFAGDCANSYNDGPPSPGAKPLGPFYEMETSSPAAALSPGGTITHIHRTYHLSGDKSSLEKVSKKLFGVSLEDIQQAFPSPE